MLPRRPGWRRRSCGSPCSGRGCRAGSAARRSRVGVGVLVEQRLRGQQHAGGAEAALHGAAIDERLLERVQRLAVGRGPRRSAPRGRPPPPPGTCRRSRPAPSTSTVQAPHTCVSHERLAPFRSSRSRSTSSRSACAGTSSLVRRPLTTIRTVTTLVLRRPRRGGYRTDGLGAARPGRGDPQRAADEHRDHLALVVGRAVRSSAGRPSAAAIAPTPRVRRRRCRPSSRRVRRASASADARRAAGRRSRRRRARPRPSCCAPSASSAERHGDAERRALVDAELHVRRRRLAGPRRRG